MSITVRCNAYVIINIVLYVAMYHNTQKTKYWEIKYIYIYKCYKATKVQADSNISIALEKKRRLC